MGGPLRAPHPLSSVPSCKQNQDMLSFYAIVIGLNNAAISRLRLTWEVRGPGPPPGCFQTPWLFRDPLGVLGPPPQGAYASWVCLAETPREIQEPVSEV